MLPPPGVGSCCSGTVAAGGRAAVDRGISLVYARPATSSTIRTTVGLLGLVELRLDDQVVALGAAKQRAVLAILALHANAPVSADRLSEGLWGERPPASAPKNVQLYVSRLRKAIEGSDAEILTRGRGYELRIDADAVDALRFERLVRDGHARDALALWRGAPLDDIADEPFAAEDIRRLDELWVRARELALDDDLAAGDHDAVLGEIDELIAGHPLHEHLHALRMLALYRSGRQADALDAFREARQRLVDDVGIEPGSELTSLHEAMLRQDPALELPARARRPAAPAEPRRRRSRMLAAGAAVAAIVIVAAVLLLAGGSGSPDSVAAPANAVAVIEPGSNRVVDAVAMPPEPGPIAATGGYVWVLNPGNGTLSRINQRTRTLAETAGIGGDHPAGNLVADADNVWVAESCQDGSKGEIARLMTTLRPLTINDQVPIPLDTSDQVRADPQAQSSPGCGIAARGLTVWSASYVPPGLARLDVDPPDSPIADVTRVRRLPFITTALAIGEGSLWVRDTRRDVVWRADPETLELQREIQTGTEPTAIAVGAGAVWVANAGDGSVSRIDPRANAATRAISVGDAPVALAVGEGAVWVANSGDGTVSRIDPATAKVVATIKTGHQPRGVAVADGHVWVTVRS
jgi:YVTN family beta-propeller protein